MHPILLIKTILSGLILAVLIIGTFYDVKYREVSNKLTGLVILIALPLIAYNWNNLGLIHVGFGIMLFGLYHFNQLGGADVKVLLPLVLVFSNPVYFIAVLAIMGLVYAIITWERKIPYFVPITTSYFFVVSSLFF